jgi:6-phosphofructokinase 1
MEDVAKSLEDAYIRGKAHAIAVVAEGAPYKVTELADYLKQHEVGFEIRLTILGHVQRGGSPTAFDRLLATRMGVEAFTHLLDGKTGVMVARSGRGQLTIPLEEVTTQTRPLSEEYYEMAEILSR